MVPMYSREKSMAIFLTTDIWISHIIQLFRKGASEARTNMLASYRTNMKNSERPIKRQISVKGNKNNSIINTYLTLFSGSSTPLYFR